VRRPQSFGNAETNVRALRSPDRKVDMKNRLAALLVFVAVASAHLLGWMAPVENLLRDQRFSAFPRKASGDVVFVAIDPHSLRGLDGWPWPRRLHAALIDRLTAAGARRIAFDIDFSAYATPEDDDALEAAIRRAGDRVILPTFRQQLKFGAAGRARVKTHSLPQFTEHASSAEIDLAPDKDGILRRYAPTGSGRISMAAALAGTAAPETPFLIDFAIRPDGIPALSYLDVLRGDFEPGRIKGRTVVIGAAAVELGDRQPVPLYGMTFDPLIHATAAESLLQKRTIHLAPTWLTLGVTLLIALTMGPLFAQFGWRGALVAVLLRCTAMIATGFAVQAITPVSLDVVPWMTVLVLGFLIEMPRRIEAQAGILFRQRMADAHHRAVMSCVVDDGADGIVVCDSRGVVTLFNTAAERMFGLPAGGAVGRRVDEVLPAVAETVRLTPPALPDDDFGATTLGPLEITLTTSRGAPVIVEMIIKSSQLSVARDRHERRGEDRRVDIYTFRDVTDQRRVEAALAAKDQAELAKRAKSEFLANMSHELRTPLNAVIGFAELLNMELYGSLGSDENRGYVSDIHASGRHLLQIINDILDVAKVEAGEVSLDDGEVALDDVVDACLRLMAERAKRAALTVETDIPDDLPALTGDKTRLKQILINLLSNAVKFTPRGGRISIRCGVAPDGGLTIAVVDTGIGIAPEHMEKAMQKFGQVDSDLQRKYDGAGLGLPLVQAMAELHQAKFTIDSAPGTGTVATVHFPPARTLAAPQSTAALAVPAE
jgi:signal transduction histidine kinase/CHASE2 domain-containing sensor protein